MRSSAPTPYGQFPGLQQSLGTPFSNVSDKQMCNLTAIGAFAVLYGINGPDLANSS